MYNLRRRFYKQESAPIVPIEDNILTFTALKDNSTVSLNRVGSPTMRSIQYSVNGGKSYRNYNFDTTITLSKAGKAVKFKGINENISNASETNYYKFVMSGKIAGSGDVTSLLNGVGGDVAVGNFCFCYMFYLCSALVTPPALPSTTLAYYCYMWMFKGCTSLVTPPELPAMTLSIKCYLGMFDNCTSLTIAPELSATTLANYCYSEMFKGCTSLTTAPELPATTLAQYCYHYMFNGCTALTTAPELPATTLAGYCYSNMFQGCTALTAAPSLPATSLKEYCYTNMFYDCTSLVTAPDLPATSLINRCYSSMFRNCSSLSYIKALFTTTPSASYTSYWVYGVAATGTFVKNSTATWNVTSLNGIPSGWTVQTATE